MVDTDPPRDQSSSKFNLRRNVTISAALAIETLKLVSDLNWHFNSLILTIRNEEEREISGERTPQSHISITDYYNIWLSWRKLNFHLYKVTKDIALHRRSKYCSNLVKNISRLVFYDFLHKQSWKISLGWWRSLNSNLTSQNNPTVDA